MTTSETYLYDGIYARFDGFQIWLRVERESGDHVIALEPAAYDALVEYANSIWKRP